MRLLGLVLALAAIAWVIFTSSGGDDRAGAVPETYQESLEKAQALEQTLDDASRKTLERLDEQER